MIALPKTLKHAGPLISTPVSRVDGPAKVTGRAKYAGEFNVPGLVYGYAVLSPIARGKIASIDASAALAMPGVLAVFTHENRPSVAWRNSKWSDPVAPSGKPFRPLYDAEIHFAMQPVALVVADTFELARAASRSVVVTYDEAPHETHIVERRGEARPAAAGGSFTPPPKPRGKPDEALAAAAAKVDHEYVHAAEHHNAMEMFATTVHVEDDGTYTVFDKIQGVASSQQYVCNVFGLAAGQVRVKAPFVGGGFGSGLRPQYQLYLAMLAATQLQRSIRVSLTRPEMFALGHRPTTWQRVALGADAGGKLTAVIHECVGSTSRFEQYAEIVVNWSGQQYTCDNVRLEHKLIDADIFTPMPMRAPGAATGAAALEIAMDELAAELKICPVAFRLNNLSMHDQNTDLPFSSKELAKAITQGAEKFGWSKRTMAPGSMTDADGKLVGYGMACGAWDAMQGQAAARAVLSVDGTLIVGSATADIGTGTYTVMTQIAAETLGLAASAVTFKLGDTALPMSPIEGGSWTVSSVGTAVKGACDAIAAKLIGFAQKMKGSPIADYAASDLALADGKIRLRTDPSKAVAIVDAMRSAGVFTIDETVRAIPNLLKQKNFTKSTHVATFVEVKVDPATLMVEVTRAVSAVAAGRIINPKTAGSQVKGAVVWGIGQALHEASVMDHAIGKFMNHDLAEYHVPVSKDVGSVDVIFVEEHDDIVNPLGAKGVGEIGLVGVAAAIANAIWHATGTRVRDLPITIDHLL